ncbi:MAG: phosphoenolpyruvate carboxykinase [Bdellovibrionales bacterium]|nr:phosphoenolpyruvate carboxykinase [Bdellovibrionales bacterium]
MNPTKNSSQFASEFTQVVQPKEKYTGLGRAQLRELAKKDEILTEYGSASYVTKFKARSAQFTRTTVDGQITDEDRQTLTKVQEYLKGVDVIEIDRQMCQGPVGTDSFGCRLWVTKSYARLGHMFFSSLGPIEGEMDTPDLFVVDVPEFPGERRILVDPDAGVTYVLGTDYYGEIKKAFLRMVMYRAKQKGGLGLHAGSKEVWAKSFKTGNIERSGMLFFGLSGTGKTSLTCHDFALDEVKGEKTRVRQDDVVMLQADGSAKGTEIEGFYIKTEGLDPTDQAALYQAATGQLAIMENVCVEANGKVDFFDTKVSQNGRAVVPVRQVVNTDGDIDMPKANKIFFITRNPLTPPIARLTKEQAAVAFMLGESIKTSAADPNAKGEPVREVGTNPFIVGSHDQEGNRFYEILKNNPEMECYLLNTGKVGESDRARKITILDTVAIIRAIARDAIEWTKSDVLKLEIPKSVEGVAIEDFDFEKVWGIQVLEQRLQGLRMERKAWLDQFPGLDKDLTASLY